MNSEWNNNYPRNQSVLIMLMRQYNMFQIIGYNFVKHCNLVIFHAICNFLLPITWLLISQNTILLMKVLIRIWTMVNYWKTLNKTSLIGANYNIKQLYHRKSKHCWGHSFSMEILPWLREWEGQDNGQSVLNLGWPRQN